MSGKEFGGLLGLKALCCGGPLLVVAIATGALAARDVAIGAAVLFGVGVSIVLARRRKALADRLDCASTPDSAPLSIRARPPKGEHARSA